MTRLNESLSSNYLRMGENFSNVLEHKDYLVLLESIDTVGVVLRAHLILEDGGFASQVQPHQAVNKSTN